MPIEFLKPTQPDLKVRKPAGGYLAAEGESLELTSYWRRRLRDGDVAISKAPRKSTKGAE